MPRVLLRLLLLGAVVAAAAPAAALAQTAPGVDKKQVAKQYVDAGLAAQSAGDYDAAVTFYAKAYDLVPHPTLLFNLAQAHRLAGRTEQALALYRRYLSEDPKGPHAGTARELVTEIEARKADAARKASDARGGDGARTTDAARKTSDAHGADGARTTDAGRKVSDARGADAARVTDEAHTGEGTQSPRSQVAERTPGEMTIDGAAAAGRDTGSPELAGAGRDTGTPELAEAGRSQRIAGIATGAAGVAALAIGIGFGLHARSLGDALSRDGARYDPDKVRAGERANTVAIVGMAGGSALIAAGAALYWWGHRQSRATEGVSLAPMLSQHTAGLVVSGALP